MYFSLKLPSVEAETFAISSAPAWIWEIMSASAAQGAVGDDLDVDAAAGLFLDLLCKAGQLDVHSVILGQIVAQLQVEAAASGGRSCAGTGSAAGGTGRKR